MSLISDALKTAQRERSGQASPGSDGQPLLEGFFPYVSTSAPEGRSKLARIAIISASSVVILGVAAWFVVPAVKRAIDARSGKVPSLVLPPREAIAPATPPIQTAQVADTQAAAALVLEPAPAGARDPEPATRSIRARTEKPSTGDATAIVPAADSAAAHRDTATARPSVKLPAASDRRGFGELAVARHNFEAEAVTAFNAGDYATARSRFESAIKATPTASAWTNYGVTLEKLGDPQAAVRAYRTAMGIDPNYFNAWLYLARVYNLLGDVTQAVPFFYRALEIEPNNSNVNADLAELEFKAGAFPEARRYADVAARSNPGNARAHYYLALSADTLKDRDVARRAFEDYLRTIIGQEKDNAPSVGYARVRLLELRGRP